MANVKPGTKYVLTNSLIGARNALSSTSANDSVIIGPSNSDGSQAWYFVETSTSGFYRLHTQQKGDFAALDVFNYNGKNALDLHMYSVQENTGQRWQLNKQDDGSIKINNQFTGSDMYLDVVKDTLQPTLAAKDGPGQRWTLSQVGSLPTALSSGFTTIAVSTSGIATTPTSTADVNTKSPVGTSSTSHSSDGLSKGAIAGIVVGGIGLIALAIGAFVLLRRKRRNGNVINNPPANSSRLMLHVRPESRH